MSVGLNQKSFTLVGAGQLGRALLDALLHAGYTCRGVVSSRLEQPKNGSYVVYQSVKEVPEFGAFTILCVPDDIIEIVSEEMTECVGLQPDTNVIHVSGSKGSDALRVLKARGVATASFHPMQTFPAGSGRAKFIGTPVGIEGEPGLCESLVEMATSMGAIPRIITPQTKRALHLCGVFVSNFMSSLFLESAGIIRQHGDKDMDFIRSHFEVIATSTLRNILERGFPEAITGPASRGDTGTMEEHLQLINDDDLKQTYLRLSKTLSRQTLPEDHPVFEWYRSRAE